MRKNCRYHNRTKYKKYWFGTIKYWNRLRKKLTESIRDTNSLNCNTRRVVNQQSSDGVHDSICSSWGWETYYFRDNWQSYWGVVTHWIRFREDSQEYTGRSKPKNYKSFTHFGCSNHFIRGKLAAKQIAIRDKSLF